MTSFTLRESGLKVGADLLLSRWLAPHFHSQKIHVLSVGLMVGRRPKVIDAPHPSNKVILCVDDDDAILSYEKALLERSGYAVITTASVQHALALVTACEFDCVLLDYGMPDMNGSDVAFEIRRMRPELKIILLSGSSVPTHALALVDAFVLKLDSSRALLPMIADLCGRIKAIHNSPVVNARAQQEC